MSAIHIFALLAILRTERVWTFSVVQVDFAETARSIGERTQIDGVADFLSSAEQLQEDIQEPDVIPEFVELERDGINLYHQALPEWDNEFETDVGSVVFTEEQHLRGEKSESSDLYGLDGMEATYDMGTIKVTTVSISDQSVQLSSFVTKGNLQWKPEPIRMSHDCAGRQEAGFPRVSQPHAHTKKLPAELRLVNGWMMMVYACGVLSVFLFTVIWMSYILASTSVKLLSNIWCKEQEDSAQDINSSAGNLKLAKANMDTDTIQAPLLSV